MHLSPTLLLLSAAAALSSSSVGASHLEVSEVVEENTHSFDKRATVKCAVTADCATAKTSYPRYGHRYCNRGVCSFRCNTGYVQSGSSACVKASTTTAAASTSTTTTAGTRAATSPAATPKLRTTYQGSDFLDKFFFESGDDPTHGLVDYLTKEEAVSAGLASVQSSGAVRLSIDRRARLAAGALRKSVRISSLEQYDAGTLIIADIQHQPVGCGAWPAFWTFNYPWPQYGEIDVIEGVNARTFNQMTLHTSAGCTRSGSLTGVGGEDTSCYAYGPSSGCTVFDYDPASYGAGFNAAGGGVYALMIAETGVSIWRWQRSNIPSDIINGAPRWRTWGTPAAQWDGATCDTRTFIQKQMITFDITACGDWAGLDSVWQDQWQSGACYPKYANCAAALRDPAAFGSAYFDVNYIKVYTV
ncbi:hypothetical protein JCM8547_001589 [Rhodosporidiobolus lusitaniae]